MDEATITQLLSKGDMRTIGHVDKVVAAALQQPELVKTLVAALSNPDRGIVMRSADALQKIHEQYPAVLRPYASDLCACLVASSQQELRWHMAQILPGLQLNEDQLTTVLALWAHDVQEAKSSIVRAFSLQALHDVAHREPEYTPQFQTALQYAKASTIPALRARAKRLA